VNFETTQHDRHRFFTLTGEAGAVVLRIRSYGDDWRVVEAGAHASTRPKFDVEPTPGECPYVVGGCYYIHLRNSEVRRMMRKWREFDHDDTVVKSQMQAWYLRYVGRESVST
jgi:hypothetical protein